MRANPKLDTEKVITELGVGEALISFLDEKGRPGVVERAFVLPPASRIGPITAEERKAVLERSPVKAVYDTTVDRESAYEKLASRAAVSAGGTGVPGAASPAGGGIMDSLKGSLGGLMTGSGRKDSLVEAMAKSAMRSVGSTVGREIVRGVLGSLLGGRRR
jgi:DNA helicase HerA-like ATPase